MSTAAHDLAIASPGTGGTCGCGAEFEGTPSEAFEQWEHHVEVTTLLRDARHHAIAEREARAAGEAAIRALLDHGVSTRDIAETIGRDDDDNLYVSPTLVQRIGRRDHVQTPRRRRRA